MDLAQLLEMLKGLSTSQLVMIGIAIFIAWPLIKDFFVKKAEVKPVDTPSLPDQEPLLEPSLSDLVYQWERLHESCETKGLTEACDALEQMFPTLVKKDIPMSKK